MGQHEILTFLKDRYKENPENWFSIKEIKGGLEKIGCSKSTVGKAPKHLYQLNAFGLVDFKITGYWDHRKVFRIKG